MDTRTESLLKHVHPDLVRVIRAAAQTPQPFEVVQGLRNPTQEHHFVLIGASQTEHSRHEPDADGWACAVDVAALTGGKVDWNGRLYAKVADQILTAAELLHIRVEWGGTWRTLKDLGHFQLPWDYPNVHERIRATEDLGKGNTI